MVASLSRRRFLGASAAGVGLAASPVAAVAEPAVLTARTGEAQLAPHGYAVTPIWGYEGQVPGPELRVPQGGWFERRLVNALPQPTTIHWHGIRIDNAMDGVPGLTQEAVPPGGSHVYRFRVPDAGTFWYHSHNRNVEQLARGLYGPLIVDDPVWPDVDADHVLMVDDWRLDPETVGIIGDFGNARDASHAGRIGNLVTVNGAFDPAMPARQGDRLRLRLINAANARVFTVGLQGLDGWVMALDGMPLATPRPMRGTLDLAPAQRIDLFVDVTAATSAPAGLTSRERDGSFGLWRLDVSAGNGAVRPDAPPPLPPNPLPVLPETLDDVPVAEMVLLGGAMRWLESARLSDTEMAGRDLAQLGKFWALNGQVGRGAAPFIAAEQGAVWRMRFVNHTNFDHGMHLHGHHFALLDGVGAIGPWRDTVLVRRGETREVVVVLDNPGIWLLHCHMLGHAEAGMVSWLEVTA